jgi:hypothetical protein
MELLRKVTAAALACGALASGGCLTADASKREPKKPDVTRLGVLPPPQNMVKPVTDPAADPAVIQAGGVQPAAPGPAGGPTAPASVHAAPALPSLSKLAAHFEKKTPAEEIGIGWRNRVAYLPDPARNGAPGAGLVGQLFLFGGPKQSFVDADGTLTVDLIDETPRPAGQKPATPERWQFSKELLLKMRTVDETFGKSYVLFLPWPAYKPDITRVRIAARYDPDDPKNGNTLFATPAVVSLDSSTPHGAPAWNGAGTTVQQNPPAGGVQRAASDPVPFGRSPSEAPGSTPVGLSGAIPLGGPLPGGAMEPIRSVNLTPPAPEPLPILPVPPAPTGTPAAATPPAAAVPPGLGPVAPPLPPGLGPTAGTLGRP